MTGLHRLLLQSTSKKPIFQKVTLKLSPCILRASFSNLPFWRAVLADMRLMTGASAGSPFPEPPAGLVALAPPAPGPQPEPAGITFDCDDDDAASPAPAPRPPEAPSFHEDRTVMEVDVAGISFVLCDDKPTTFGAPDALQVSLERLLLSYSQHTQAAGTPPERMAELGLALKASFLNNSASR